MILLLVLSLTVTLLTPVFAEEEKAPTEEPIIEESSESGSDAGTEIDETINEDPEETEIVTETGVPVNEDDISEEQEEGINQILVICCLGNM